MRPRTLFFVLVLPLAAPSLRAQSARLDQPEILGRLAASYSPSYIAHLVKTRGLNFSPTQDFVYRVKLAGGDGILVDRLSSGDSLPSVVSSADQDVPVRHLAKCAELIHTGAVESAENECRAAIDENPKSPWPLLVTARLLEPNQRFGGPFPTDTSKAERSQLLQRAAFLAPNLALTHLELASDFSVSQSWPQAGRESQTANSLDADHLEASQLSKLNSPGGPGVHTFGNVMDFGPAFYPSAPDSPSVPDQPVVLNPETLRLIKIDPDLADNHFLVGMQYAMAHQFDRARSEFQEAMRLEPGNGEYHIFLGMLYLAQNRPDAGLGELHEAVQLAPAAVPPRLVLAGFLEMQKRTPEATAELQATLSIHPASIAVSDALVKLFLDRKDKKSAILELRRSLDVTSAQFTDQAKFVEARYPALQQLAELLAQDRQLDAAAQQYIFLLRFKSNDADLHNDYGNVLLDQHHIDEALGEYTEAARLDPKMSTAHHNIGLCLSMKKNFDGAIAEFRQTLELNPNEPRTRVLLGTALGQKGNLQGATEQFQQSIAENPKDPDAHLGIAYAFDQLKNTSAEIDELKTVLDLQPDSIEALNDLAWIYCTAEERKFRNPAEALTLARRAVSESPAPNPAYLDTLAEALLLNGQPAAALATELQAVKLDPENPELQSRLPRFREAANTHTLPKP
jgi:tetratricopeptide (TPR) repeat protein